MATTTPLDSLSPAAAAAATGLAAAVLAYKLLSAPTPTPPAGLQLPRRLANSSALFGDALELSRNAERYYDWLYEKTLECGGAPWVQRVPTLNDMVMVATPDLIEDVAKTQAATFGKGELTHQLFYDLVGDAFFSMDGDKWFHQRKTASKFFTARMFRDVATKSINAHADTLLSVLATAHAANTQLNLTKLIHEFTLETFAELGFGLQMHAIGAAQGHPLDKALGDAFPQILARTQMPPWLWKLQKWLNVGGEKAYAKTTHYIRTLVSEMVATSLEQSEQHPRDEAATIVELFINAMRNGEGDVTPELLCDIAIMFTIGGRDTSADTMNWVLYHMSKYPAVEHKVRHELWDQFPELMEGKVKALTMEQTQALVYMEAVIRETLRLYPVVPLYVRRAASDAVLVDGTFIAKGTSVTMCPYTTGRLESVWGEDALEFKPERFIDAATNKLRVFPAYKFFSFGAGPKICIGMNLAMLEMKLVLSAMLSRFRFDVAPNDGSIAFSASLPLKNPLLVHVHPAQAVSS